MSRLWSLIRETATQWSEHKTARLGAALAYYTVFSLGPLMIIAISIAGLVLGHAAARGEVELQARALLGDVGAQAVAQMLSAAARPFQGAIASVIGFGALIFAAVGMMAQLKDAMNTVWNVRVPPTAGWWPLIRSYILSLAGVIAFSVLLLCSLLLTAAVAASGKYLAPFLPETTLHLVSTAASFVITMLLFAAAFKWLPDTDVTWQDVWLGAGLTAVLFNVGRFLIGLYIGKQGLESLYGAAASIMVLMLWVYYSAQIVLLGAEFTHAFARRHGSRQTPQ